LYTPQRLFGEVGLSSEILSHEPFLERARLQREQEQDSSARLAMGAYLVARLVDKLLSLPFDNEAAEGFSWQLEAVRRHISELPGDTPETAHLSGVVSAITVNGFPTASLWKSLTAYAYFLEHEGRLEESLEVLTLAVRSHGGQLSPAEFLPYALLAGRLNRLLARWDPATMCYQAALDAATRTGDRNRTLRARLGRAHVDRARGNLPQARREVEEVISEAEKSDLPDVQSDAHLDLGVLLMLQGARAESLEATYNAFRLSQDPLSRMRILGDLGYALNESGYYSAARVALEIVANSDSSYLVKLNAILELMQLESAVGNRVAFERRRQQARELAGRMTPSMAVDYRYKTALGLGRFDQVARAREIAVEALALAEQHHLNEWYFRIERMLQDLESTATREKELQAPAEVDATPAVLQMTSGLREYASLAAV
jgi:tetratricopeptide (TPR) repeat protein